MSLAALPPCPGPSTWITSSLPPVTGWRSAGGGWRTWPPRADRRWTPPTSPPPPSAANVPAAPQRTPEETRRALDEVSRQREQTDQALNRARGRLSALGEAPVEELPQPCPAPQHSPQETQRALEAALAQLEALRARLNQAHGVLGSMGEESVLSARQEELTEALARRTLEYDALELAMETMAQANTRLQERFSPELNRLSGEYLARLTGGAYQSVSLSRELEGSVRGREDLLPHSALYLSRGTADHL